MNAPTPVTALSQAALQGQQLPHESAALHVSGHATYTDAGPFALLGAVHRLERERERRRGEKRSGERSYETK